MPSLQHANGTSLLHLFCQIDDFCQQFLPAFRAHQVQPGELSKRRRKRQRSLCESEIMTILVAFHLSHYRDFKTFYLFHVCPHWKGEFPGLISYNRFIEFIPAVLVPLLAYLRALGGPGHCSGISFVDSTALSVCHNARIKQHKVFAGIAKRGKTSAGWFFGFKLHLVVNDEGHLLNFALTTGEGDDRTPVPDLLKSLFGKVFADRGYVSQALFDLLFAQGIELITKTKKKMKPRLLRLLDKVLLRKRALVETIIDQLKNVSQVEHTRHRAPSGFVWNLLAALIAYCHLPKKPSLHLRDPIAIPAA
jgi:hypothetical protein